MVIKKSYRAPVAALAALLLAYGGTVTVGLLWPQGASQAVSSPVGPAGCPSEDGGPVLPCAWRCESMGNRRCGPGAPKIIIYRLGPTGEINVCVPRDDAMVCQPHETGE
jgi:hypothetical protein